MSRKHHIKKYAPSLAVILLAILVFGFFLYRNSVKAVPGSVLYPVKMQMERLVGYTKTGSAEKIDYEVKLADTRLLELKKVGQDTTKATQLITKLSGHFDNIETDYGNLVKEGNNEKAFDYFEKINFSIYSFLRTLEASKQTYKANSAYKEVINKGTSRLNKSIDKLFEVSVNDLAEYPEFLKYAIQTFEGYQYRKVFEQIQYAREDIEAVKSIAKPEEYTQLQTMLDNYQKQYDELMKKRSEITVKEIYEILKQLKDKDLEISKKLVEITQKNAQAVKPAK